MKTKNLLLAAVVASIVLFVILRPRAASTLAPVNCNAIAPTATPASFVANIIDGNLKHIGGYPQPHDFSKSDTTSSNGEPVYIINQAMDMTASNLGRTWGTSYLTKSMLSDYAVFSDRLPK
jgi:hypothetical protein